MVRTLLWGFCVTVALISKVQSQEGWEVLPDCVST